MASASAQAQPSTILGSSPTSASALLASKRRGSSTHRTNPFCPVLISSSTQHLDLQITASRKRGSVAVSFHRSALLHTQLEVRQGAYPAIVTRLSDIDPTAAPPPVLESTRALWNALFLYFATGSDSPLSYLVELPLPSTVLHASLLALGAIHHSPSYTISRSAIFQLYSYATTSTLALPFPYILSTPAAPTLSHPVRAPKPAAHSVLYSRQIPHLDCYFKLAVCGPNDLPTLHTWLNDERVDVFWQEKGTWEQHETFLAERTADAHVVPVIGSYVTASKEGVVEADEQATYSEVYWVKEDRLGQLLGEAKVDDYDRGIHMLVGSNAHRGPHRIRGWLPSLVHFCFLDDVRTRRVVAEPNEKNGKMIEYLESVGFVRHGDVVFPHKTAAFMVCEKNAFYERCPF